MPGSFLLPSGCTVHRAWGQSQYGARLFLLLFPDSHCCCELCPTAQRFKYLPGAELLTKRSGKKNAWQRASKAALRILVFFCFVLTFYCRGSCIMWPYILCMYLTIVCACACMHMWMSEDILQEPILSFYHVGPMDQTQAARLSDKCLFPPSHLTGSVFLFHQGKS